MKLSKFGCVQGLRGSKGEPGEIGLPGKDGADGRRGAPGSPVCITILKFWEIQFSSRSLQTLPVM